MLHALAAHIHGTKAGQPSAFQAKAFETFGKIANNSMPAPARFAGPSAQYLGKSTEAGILIHKPGKRRENATTTGHVCADPTCNFQPATCNFGSQQPRIGARTAFTGAGRTAVWRRTAFALRGAVGDRSAEQTDRTGQQLADQNRRGAQWNNTRDTAIVVLALNDYLRVSGELSPKP